MGVFNAKNGGAGVRFSVDNLLVIVWGLLEGLKKFLILSTDIPFLTGFNSLYHVFPNTLSTFFYIFNFL